MAIEIIAGETYRNRRGEYQVLEVSHDGRLKVRYVQDGTLAELDMIQQLRILTNMETEAYVQAQVIANAKPVPPPRSTSAKTSRATPVAKSPRATATKTPADRRATTPVRAQNVLAALPQLKPTVPVRQEFSKQEVLLLLKFIGYGNPAASYWFIGNQEIGPRDGATILSERSEEVEFHKEFTDAAIYKNRYRNETTYPYGSPAWQFASHLLSRLVASDQDQSDEGRQRYFQEQFGATEGDVLLIDAISLPAASFDAAHWPYQNVSITDSPRYNDVLRDPKLFAEDQLFGQATRYKRLSELYDGLKIQKKAPDFVFCFGRPTTWRGYKEIFPNVSTYNDVELKLSSDRDRTARLSLGQDEESGTRIVLLPPLNPQDGMTYYYLDQLASVLQTLKKA